MKSFLLFCGLSVTILGSGQITVPEVTKSFYGVVEATWCGNCGQYGHPDTEDIIAQGGDRAVYVGLHRSSSSALHASVANDLATEMGVSGQPIFTLNGEVIGPHSGTLVSTVVAGISNYYQASTATVNTGFNAGIVGDTLYVNTKTTFFSQLSGNYQMAVYVIEDSIWEYQANYDPGIPNGDIWHNHILRTSLNGSFGEFIAGGTVNAGTEILKNYKISLDPSWNPDQIDIVTAIWKEEAGSYSFVNANDVGGILTGNVGLEQDEMRILSVYPNPSQGGITIITAPGETNQLEIYNMTGQLVYQELLNSGKTTVDLYQLDPGQYFLSVKSENGIYVTKKITILP